MREIYDFRIPEERAAAELPPGAGKVLPGGSVRKVEAAAGSDLLTQVIDAQCRARRQGRLFYLSWGVRRRSSARELEQASLFRVQVTPANQVFEYHDEIHRQIICIDRRRLPRRPLFSTLGGDLLVAEPLAAALSESELSGFTLERIRHREFREEQSYSLEGTEAGRALVRKAFAAGCPYPSGAFWRWLSEPEQQQLLEQARHDDWARGEGRRRRRELEPAPWFQLIVTSSPVAVTKPTRFGTGPGDEDAGGEYRCPEQMIAGLNILSSCHVAEETWDRSDVVQTDVRIGRAAGLLRPNPLILVSRRARALLLEHGVSPNAFETACLTSGAEPVLSS